MDCRAHFSFGQLHDKKTTSATGSYLATGRYISNTAAHWILTLGCFPFKHTRVAECTLRWLATSILAERSLLTH